MSRQRIALCLQYDGAAFQGWQRQPRQASVQETLEEAISDLDPGASKRVVAAGRTDSGVHAAGQVVHFDAMGPIPPQRWPKALNGRLPPTIRVRSARAVPDDWHACFTASHRRYRYTIHNACTPNLFLAAWTWHRHQVRLEEQTMARCLEALLGEHDFSAFQRAGSRRAHAVTTLQEVLVRRLGDLVVVEIQASGFLYGMVRLIMGQLVAVGEGRLRPEAFVDRWRRRARDEVREAAPPRGLCLLRVGYPTPIFPEALCYDSQPRFLLESSDPPPPASGVRGS
ncbi:MAG: tRNA pseudouridine(38-40) synthase TruA [Cyanobacteriota bacterium]